MRSFLAASVSFLLFVLLDAKSECFGKCSDDNSCGVWLETTKSKSGLYSLRDSQLNLTCSFLSLPITATVQWKFKQKGRNHWSDANCKTHHEYECNASALSEHRTVASCSGALGLEESGTYRCETKFQGELVYGTESHVEVIGIDDASFQVTDAKLTRGQPGFFDIEVCANPKPQIFFISDDHVLQPGESASKYAASELTKSKRTPASADGPADWHAFCYTSRLLISETSDGDLASWKATALVAQDSQTIDLTGKSCAASLPNSFGMFLALYFVYLIV